MNSNRKGKRGEREFAAVLREAGFDARRGQQFAGGPDSPDVACKALAWLHVEVKRVQRLNVAEACSQASTDAGGKPFVATHRRNGSPWFVTMRADFFLPFLHQKDSKSLYSSSPRKGKSSRKHNKDGILQRNERLGTTIA